METLSKKIRKKSEAKIKIRQFGEGNFLRAFVDWLIQKRNDSGKYSGHVVVVQPLPFGRIEELKKQDYLYTLILQGINEKGEAVKTHEVIDVIDDSVNPYTDFAKYLKYGESKDLEVVISNTTEAGIHYEEGDTKLDLSKDTPVSYPGKLLALLKHRYETLGKDYGLAIIPCELIDDNGDHLREVLNQLATKRNLDQGFIDYLNHSCHYTSTLVDRIVPGFPRDEFNKLCEDYGYIDNNRDKGEYFHFYVLKKEPFVQEKFPVDKVGLHAVYVEDVHPYKQRKVRILNGSHTSLVPVAYLSGYDEVRQSLLDARIRKFLEDEQNKEILPTLTAKGSEQFAKDVRKRFLNPYVHHALRSIALNSLPKFKERDLPTIRDNLKEGKIPSHLIFAFAALLVFYRGYRIKDGVKEEIKLQDDQKNLAFTKGLWVAFEKDGDVKKLADSFLSDKELWGEDLSEVPALANEFVSSLTLILNEKDRMSALRKKFHE